MTKKEIAIMWLMILLLGVIICQLQVTYKGNAVFHPSIYGIKNILKEHGARV